MRGLALVLLTALADGGLEPVEIQTPAVALATLTTGREYVEELLEDGHHIRFGTENQGPVHVWTPSSYRPQGASVVIYLHGFYSTADSAFFEHRLATQFRDSGRNAVFIVPEVPSWRTDPIFWDDLEELLTQVFARARLKRPEGPVMLVAHSGAYRNVVEWLAHPRVKQVVLLDALYGGEKDFQTWLATTMVSGKQLVMVGFETVQRTDWFLKLHPAAVRLDDVPYLYDRLPRPNAPVMYFVSDRFDHMAMVTDGRVLPYLLHALP